MPNTQYNLLLQKTPFEKFFIIFLIVVNIGYVLYYAAIITIDMNSKGKQTEDNTVNVEVEGITDDRSGEYAK